MSNFDWIVGTPPTTEDIYIAYRNWNDPEYLNPDADAKWVAVNREEFDTWLLTIQAEAWDACVGHLEATLGQELKRAALADNPYRQKEES